MDKNKLLVHDYVCLKNMHWIIGQVHYGQWWNESLGITKPQYGSYILFYDEDWFRIGFDNINFDYIERTDKSLPTYPMS